MIVGFVAVAYKVERRTKSSISSTLIYILQRATNVVLRSVIGRRISSEPTLAASRAAFIIVVLSGFVIITIYRANLVAFIAVEPDIPPIKSLDELGNTNYQLAVLKDSSWDTMFHDANNGSDEHTLHRFSYGIIKFVDKMVNGEDSADQTILFCYHTIPRYSKHYPCSLLNIKNYRRDNKQSMGLIYKKNWPFTRFLNYHLLSLKEIGMMDRLYEPYLMSTRKSCLDDRIIRPVIKMPKPVGTNITFSLYLIILLGFVCALVLLMIEIVCQKYFSRA